MRATFFDNDNALDVMRDLEDSTPQGRPDLVVAALDEVLRVKGLAVAQGVGVVSTGVPVLRTEDRDPAELIVTPRKDGEVRTGTDLSITVFAATDPAVQESATKEPKATKAPKVTKKI